MDNKKTFGDNINQVEEILKRLEDGDVSLEESIDSYKSGMEIIKECSEKIEQIEKDLKIVKIDEDDAE